MLSLVNTRLFFSPAYDRNFDRLSKYKLYENELEFKGIINFPMDIQDIYKFQIKYNIKIVYLK